MILCDAPMFDSVYYAAEKVMCEIQTRQLQIAHFAPSLQLAMITSSLYH